jgi:SAM-dependent methyltransferase
VADKVDTSRLSLKKNHTHAWHTWIVGVLGLIAGLLLLVYVPGQGAISKSVLLFSGFHIVGGIVVLSSMYILGIRRLVRRLFRRQIAQATQVSETYDFGWGPEWMNGLAVAALVAFSAAVAIQVTAPDFWPVAFLVLLLAAAFFTGNAIMRSFRGLDYMVLPMVGLLRGDEDVVLDAGCGAGRTTVALSRGLRNGRIVAVDRFDAHYIDDGGRPLLEHNLRVAGLTDRVRIEKADLVALPFDAASFDSAVSTNVYDHLGHHKEQALREIHRVLKPGGRFLMAVWVPGLAMFAVGNVLSFFLTSKAGWRAMARRAGLEVVDEGIFNSAWFVVLQKPTVPVS